MPRKIRRPRARKKETVSKGFHSFPAVTKLGNIRQEQAAREALVKEVFSRARIYLADTVQEEREAKGLKPWCQKDIGRSIQLLAFYFGLHNDMPRGFENPQHSVLCKVQLTFVAHCYSADLAGLPGHIMPWYPNTLRFWQRLASSMRS